MPDGAAVLLALADALAHISNHHPRELAE